MSIKSYREKAYYISVVKKRSNVMPKQQFSELIRTTNPEQCVLIHEVIHRLHDCGDEVVVTLQVFFTGPAGCGKTFSVKCLRETYNRYTQEHNSLNSVYVTCASTGKAAVPIGGTTVRRRRLSVSSHKFSSDKTSFC